MTHRRLTHHACYILGNLSTRTRLVEMLATDYNLITPGNPDFFDLSFETFTIDDARQLKSLHSTRSVGSSEKKIFVLTMNGITVEAQNALLKLFEEPAAYAHFFVIIPSAHLLLPTVRSRMQVFHLQADPHKQSHKNIKSEEGKIDDKLRKTAETFLSLPTAQRLEHIKKLTDDISKEKKTKQHTVDLLNAIESILHERGVSQHTKSLEVIELARTYMHDRAPSLKMLLEYIALNI